MYVKIQTSDKSNGNKGSSIQLVKYLEKEDLLNEKQSLDNQELPEKRKGFFSQDRDSISSSEVVEKIDRNKKALGKNDAKFYSLTLSPSEKEQQFLLKDITGNKEIKSINNLTENEKQLFENKLKDYSRSTMDKYAENFKRNGLKDGSQLVYYGKVEHYRSYKGTDKEVLYNKNKSGEIKPGLNSHVHIIVSRKDKEQKLKLSPLANERARKSNSKLNGKSVVRGFDRVEFKKVSETTFDNKFKYERNNNEKVTVMMKNNKNELTHNNDLLKTPKDITKLYNGVSDDPNVSNHPKAVRIRAFAERSEKLNEMAKNNLAYKQKFERDNISSPDYDKALDQLVKDEKIKLKNLDFEM